MLDNVFLRNRTYKVSQISRLLKKVHLRTSKLPPSKIAFRTPESLVSNPQRSGNPRLRTAELEHMATIEFC